MSATVVADRCAVADAYATAFMAMGREQAKKLKEQHPEIEYLFIYADSLGGYAKEFSPGMEKYPTGIGSVLPEDVRHPCPVSSRSLPGMAHMPGGEDNVEFVYRSFGVTFNIAVNIYAGFRIFL